MVADSITIVWEYYKKDVGWVSLERYQDDTNGFQNSGVNVIRFPAQWKWERTAVNGVYGSWVRARITSVSNITEGGANQNTAPYAKDGMVNINGYTESSPCTFTDVANYLETNYSYLGTLKIGNYFDFRWIGLNINSRLKTTEEIIEIGNSPNSYLILRNQNWDYLQSGEKVGTESGKKGSLFLCHFRPNAYLFNFGDNTKLYGTTILTDNAQGGYPYVKGEVLDCHLDMIPRLYGTVKNTRIRLGNVGFIAFDPTEFSKNKVIIGDKGVYCYQKSLVFDKLDYEFDGGNAMLYLYQTYSDVTFTFNDPVTPLPSQSSSPRMIDRIVVSAGNIAHFFNYDNTSGFTDQTTEANDNNSDDVNLTGATGDPEVGDAIYICLGTGAWWQAYSRLDFTMGSVVNSDNTYIWEIYAGGAWREAKIWDGTENFTKSGKIWISMRAEDDTYFTKTTVNGVNGYWVRARITSAGSSKPVATKIQGARETGVSRWYAYEKYSFNLKVVDQEGNGISGVNVIVKDSNGNEKFSVTTGTDGAIDEQMLIAKSYYFDPINYYTNYKQIAEIVEGAYTLQIFKEGYQTYTKKFTLNKKIDWIIRLEKSKVSVDQEVLL